MREDDFTTTPDAAAAYARMGAYPDDDRPSAHDLAVEQAQTEAERRKQAQIANARRAAEALQRARERNAAGLIRWSVGRAGDPRFREDMTQAELAALGDCPVCGKPMTDCHGHARFGDPLGYQILRQHDADRHHLCAPGVCNPTH